MVLQQGQVDLQEYANGSFVSNRNMFTIIFFNTYYHKQINKILIAAFNEPLRDKIHHYSKHFWYSGGYAVGRQEALLKMTVSQKRNDWKRAVY